MTIDWSEKPIALITGASSGIGTELAKVFAAHGHNLILTGRNETSLKQVSEYCQMQYSIHVSMFVQDLSLPNAAVELANFVKQLPAEIDVLVNNAGFGVYGEFATNDQQANLELL